VREWTPSRMIHVHGKQYGVTTTPVLYSNPMKGSVGHSMQIVRGLKGGPPSKRDRKLRAIKQIGPPPPYSGFPISTYCDDCNHKAANHGPQRCAVGSCQCRLFSA
jgi:hypothetical protein